MTVDLPRTVSQFVEKLSSGLELENISRILISEDLVHAKDGNPFEGLPPFVAAQNAIANGSHQRFGNLIDIFNGFNGFIDALRNSKLPYSGIRVFTSSSPTRIPTRLEGGIRGAPEAVKAKVDKAELVQNVCLSVQELTIRGIPPLVFFPRFSITTMAIPCSVRFFDADASTLSQTVFFSAYVQS